MKLDFMRKKLKIEHYNKKNSEKITKLQKNKNKKTRPAVRCRKLTVINKTRHPPLDDNSDPPHKYEENATYIYIQL
jgi:hypothetical protein